MWPYDPQKWPPAECYTFAEDHKAIRSKSLPLDLAHMKACFVEGFPFTSGIVVYSNYCAPTTSGTDDILVPDRTTENVMGGHALLVVGYHAAKEQFLVRNSIGPTWGQHGYGTLPFAYAADPDLSDSTWTIRYVA